MFSHQPDTHHVGDLTVKLDRPGTETNFSIMNNQADNPQQKAYL